MLKARCTWPEFPESLPGGSHRRPARLSPQASSTTQAGWAASSPPAGWVPISCLPFSFTACSCGSSSPSACVRHGCFFPTAPPLGAVHFTLLPSHPGHQDSWTCALCPCSFRAPSPPAHRLATPCTSHTVPLSTVTPGFLVTNRILTRRASCASGGLSTQLSSMRLLGLIVRCVLLSRGCLSPPCHPAPLPSILHSRGSRVGLGHPALIHPYSGSKPSTWP